MGPTQHDGYDAEVRWRDPCLLSDAAPGQCSPTSPRMGAWPAFRLPTGLVGQLAIESGLRPSTYVILHWLWASRACVSHEWGAY